MLFASGRPWSSRVRQLKLADLQISNALLTIPDLYYKVDPAWLLTCLLVVKITIVWFLEGLCFLIL